MKSTFITCLIMTAFSISYGQNFYEIPCLDSSEFTITNYPVKLTNNIEELENTLTDHIILSKEDIYFDEKYTFLISVDCNGQTTLVRTLRFEGSNLLSDKLKEEISKYCKWFPAINQNYRVASFYNLVIQVKNGKCKIIE